MRPLELVLVLLAMASLALPGGALLLRALRIAVRVLLALVLVAHVFVEGAHWQMIPCYLACLVILLGWPRLRRRGLLAALLLPLIAASVALTWVLPVFHLPLPTGEHPVGTRTLHVVDQNRAGGPREIVAQLWYPAVETGKRARYARRSELKPWMRYESLVRTNAFQDAPFAAAGGPFPIVLFNPRWRGARTQDTFVAEDLASHGFVVVAIDHPRNSALVELTGGRVVRGAPYSALDNVEASSALVVEALWADELRVWTADTSFVLDRLLAESHREGGWLQHHLYEDRIVAFGHSFGGATSVALLGLDPRVRSGMNLDGWNFNAIDHREGQPMMQVYAGAWPLSLPTARVERQLDQVDNAAVDENLARYGGTQVYVANTQHLDFTDATLVSPLQRLTYTGPLPAEQARTLTRALVLNFFERTLNGVNAPIPQFDGVTVRVSPPPSAPATH